MRTRLAEYKRVKLGPKIEQTHQTTEFRAAVEKKLSA